MKEIKIISRNSPLALWQTQHVKQQLETHHRNISIEIITRTTQGDRTTLPLNKIGGKGLFVKELQQIVLNNEADIAVHSAKDLSVHDTGGLIIAAFLSREDPRDVFISKTGCHLSDLLPNAIIGTSSPRRHCLLHDIRPDLTIHELRGNVGTRLEKLSSGAYDAIVLAAAGLKRLGLINQATQYFDPQIFIPAIGQGVIAVECRKNDEEIIQLLSFLDDHPTRQCILAERAVNRELNGDCFTPLGAYATIQRDRLELHGMLGNLESKKIYRAQVSGPIDAAESLGKRLGLELGVA